MYQVPMGGRCRCRAHGLGSPLFLSPSAFEISRVGMPLRLPPYAPAASPHRRRACCCSANRLRAAGLCVGEVSSRSVRNGRSAAPLRDGDGTWIKRSETAQLRLPFRPACCSRCSRGVHGNSVAAAPVLGRISEGLDRTCGGLPPGAAAPATHLGAGADPPIWRALLPLSGSSIQHATQREIKRKGQQDMNISFIWRETI